MKGQIVLEDGSLFEGEAASPFKEVSGEICLNTAVVGYQEMMTDPANAGKILVLTYPLIGNYGVRAEFKQSRKCWLKALIIKEKSRVYSNWMAEESLDNFLAKQNLPFLSEVDTRTLAVKIRDKGEMFALVDSSGQKKEKLLKKMAEHKKKYKKNYLKEISVKKITRLRPPPGGGQRKGDSFRLAVLDLGICQNFLKQLERLGAEIYLFPYKSKASEILELNPRGILISGGPEEDEAIPEVTRTVKGLIGKKPILAISAGHEILALALGAKRKPLKAGHRGVNYPIVKPGSLKGEITVQNHRFCVEKNSLKGSSFRVRAVNLNDRTVEEIYSPKLKVISVQYYPTSPGFEEIHRVFSEFGEMMRRK
jgi:carbamoyl-phosphate synthase small subunit